MTNPGSVSIRETSVNVLAAGSEVVGTIKLCDTSRVHGVVRGDVQALDGSLVVLAESALVEGNLQVDRVIIDGFVRGNVHAKTQAIVSRTGRVLGDIRSPSIVIEHGAHFEGQCWMAALTSSPQPKTA